jgi:hypothetical protein
MNKDRTEQKATVIEETIKAYNILFGIPKFITICLAET